MKTRWKILLTVAIGPPALAIIWLLSMHYQSTSELEAYKQQLRAQGEKLEVSELVPPPPKPEDNGAELANQAFQLMIKPGSHFNLDGQAWPLSMRIVTPGRAMVGSVQPDVRKGAIIRSWDEVRAEVTTWEPAFALLRQAGTLPTLDFHPDYHSGLGEQTLNTLYIYELQLSAVKLEETAMYHLHGADTAAATTNLCTALALLRGAQNDRLFLSQNMRIAMAQTAASASWELLQTTNLAETDLAKLQTAWESVEFKEPLEHSLEMERAMAKPVLEYQRNFGTTLYEPILGSRLADWWNNPAVQFRQSCNNLKAREAFFIWRTSQSYDNELRRLEFAQTILSVIRSAVTNRALYPAFTNMAEKMTECQAAQPTGRGHFWQTLGVSDELTRLSNAGFMLDENIATNLVIYLISAEAAKQLAVTAIALKRFQLEHGGWPEKLAELAPKYLVAVPLDPVDGEPLRYRRTTDGTFLLYSVGINGADDGGDPALLAGAENPSLYWLNQDALDWVWPQPATAAEVEAFYQKQAKGN